MFERAGASAKGTITGLYTVLVEGSDMEDPIANSVRSILDGHIVLDRKLAQKNHYPAIDVLQSISRCRSDVSDPELLKKANGLVRSLAKYKEVEDLIQIGAYVPGSDPEIDLAIQRRKPLEELLIQGMEEPSDPNGLRESSSNLRDDLDGSFCFQLETLLRVRTIKEEEAEREFAVAQRHVVHKRGLVDSKDNEISLAQQERRVEAGLNAHWQQQSVLWVGHLQDEKRVLIEDLKEAKKEAEAKRVLL